VVIAKRVDSGKSKFSGQDAPSVPQQRALHTSLEFQKIDKALVFQSTVCIFGYRQFPPPMIKLPFKTADVQGQSRQSNFQNLSIRKFDGLARIVEVCMKFVLAQLCFWVRIEDGGSNDVRHY